MRYLRTADRVASRATLVVVALLTLGNFAVSAQTLTGSIFGTVFDTGGLALPGVTVTVSSPQLIQGQESRVTNDRGQYRFPALPPGTYTVTFELSGFAVLRREDVALQAGTAVGVNERLAVAGVRETVTVRGGSPLVDVKQSQRQETMTQEILEHTPVRLFVDAYHLLPGVVDGQYRDITPGASSVHGSTSKQNRLNLEGANLDDAAYGYPASDVSPEIIQEMQVTTAGVSAEFGGAAGAVINVITKSGGNAFSGALTTFFNNDKLQGSNITDALRAEGLSVGTTQKLRWSAGGSLGGPVLRNKVWFFGDFQRREEEFTMIDFPWTITDEQDMYFGKLTSQIASKHRLEGFTQYRTQYQYPFIPDVDLKDEKVIRDSDFTNPVASLKWLGTLTANTFLEANTSFMNLTWNAGWPHSSRDEIGYTDRSTGDIFGGIYRGHGTPVRRNNRRVKADISHFTDKFLHGSHEFKGGLALDRLITSEHRDWGNHGMGLQLFNGAPDRVVISNFPVNPVGTADTLSFYLQDQWSVRRLTLNLGLRFERSEFWFPATELGGINIPVQQFPEQRDVASFNTLSPRLGVVYDLTGDQRTVVKASWGRFYNQIASRDFIDAAPFAEGAWTYRWNDLNGDLLYQANERGTLVSDTTVPNPSAIDPNLKPSYWENFTVGLERELFKGAALGISGIFKKEYDVVETIDAGKPFDEAYLPVSVINPLTDSPLTVYALKPEFQAKPVQRFVTNPTAGMCSFCSDPPSLQYRGLEFTFNRRMENRWQLHGSYVWSKAEGNRGTHHRTTLSSVYANPNNLVNAWGRSTLDRPHQFKLMGTVQAPLDLWLSMVYVGQSGVPYQQAMGVLGRTVAFTTADSPLLAFERIITVKGEAPGTLRMSTQHLVSVRGDKRFNLGANRQLGIVLDVTNLLNTSAVNYVRNVRVDQPTFGLAGDLVLPRTLRLGLRFSF